MVYLRGTESQDVLMFFGRAAQFDMAIVTKTETERKDAPKPCNLKGSCKLLMLLKSCQNAFCVIGPARSLKSPKDWWWSSMMDEESNKMAVVFRNFTLQFGFDLKVGSMRIVSKLGSRKPTNFLKTKDIAKQRSHDVFNRCCRFEILWDILYFLFILLPTIFIQGFSDIVFTD